MVAAADKNDQPSKAGLDQKSANAPNDDHERPSLGSVSV
jgi:hypothetical protein